MARPNTEVQHIQIGIWGSIGSGKTTYLAALYHAREHSHWQMNPADDDSIKFILDTTKVLFEGNFPPATDPNQAPKVYTYHFSKRQDILDTWGRVIFGDRGQRIFAVSFLDAAGGYFEDPDAYPFEICDGQGTVIYRDVWDYLARCRGLICILDPDRGKEYFEIAFRALSKLSLVINTGRPGYIDRYMAFCLSKMDKPKHYDYLSCPESYAEQVLGQRTIGVIRDSCPENRRRFFGISSIGRNARGEYNVTDDNLYNYSARIQDAEEIKPINIFQPIEWLFERLSAEKK